MDYRQAEQQFQNNRPGGVPAEVADMIWGKFALACRDIRNADPLARAVVVAHRIERGPLVDALDQVRVAGLELIDRKSAQCPGAEAGARVVAQVVLSGRITPEDVHQLYGFSSVWADRLAKAAGCQSVGAMLTVLRERPLIGYPAVHAVLSSADQIIALGETHL